jgi:hypothetical protein
MDKGELALFDPQEDLTALHFEKCKKSFNDGFSCGLADRKGGLGTKGVFWRASRPCPSRRSLPQKGAA